MATSSNIPPLTAERNEREALESSINEMYRWYSRGSECWSFGYHSLLYLSAAFSAAASVILKLDVLKDRHPTDISAILAASSALFTTLIAGGGFSRKWKANRIARGKVYKLKLDLQDPKTAVGDIRKELQKVVFEQDEQIAGTS